MQHNVLSERVTPSSLATLNERFEQSPPQEILRWAWETYGEGAVMTSSFQTQSLPLLHLLSETAPRIPVLFLDTGFHFPETLAFRDRVAEALDLDVRTLTCKIGHERFRTLHGELHRWAPDRCCYVNKVEPLTEALQGYDVWITGVRRDQNAHRRDTPFLSEGKSGAYKLCPMAAWTAQDAEAYIDRHGLPRHPLTEQGYASIGCAPCTMPARNGEAGGGARAGRWKGQEKTECGLHLFEAC